MCRSGQMTNLMKKRLILLCQDGKGKTPSETKTHGSDYKDNVGYWDLVLAYSVQQHASLLHSLHYR